MARLPIKDPSPEIRIKSEGPSTVIEMAGKLTGVVPADIREQVLALIKPGCRLIFDVSGVSGFSGVAIRMLLMFSRMVRAAGGSIAVRRVSPQIEDLADAAGFLRLFEESSPEGALQDRPVAPRIDSYPTHRYGKLALRKGFPVPFGATGVMRGINFSVYSRHAASCTLVLFEQGVEQPFAEIPFPAGFRIGDVFAMIVFDLDPDTIEYGFRMYGPWAPVEGHRFDSSKVLMDPTARSVSGRGVWAPVRTWRSRTLIAAVSWPRTSTGRTIARSPCRSTT